MKIYGDGRACYELSYAEIRDYAEQAKEDDKRYWEERERWDVWEERDKEIDPYNEDMRFDDVESRHRVAEKEAAYKPEAMPKSRRDYRAALLQQYLARTQGVKS